MVICYSSSKKWHLQFSPVHRWAGPDLLKVPSPIRPHRTHLISSWKMMHLSKLPCSKEWLWDPSLTKKVSVEIHGLRPLGKLCFHCFSRWDRFGFSLRIPELKNTLPGIKEAESNCHVASALHGVSSLCHPQIFWVLVNSLPSPH